MNLSQNATNAYPRAANGAAEIQAYVSQIQDGVRDITAASRVAPIAPTTDLTTAAASLGVISAGAMVYQAAEALSNDQTRMVFAHGADAVRTATRSSFDIARNFVKVGATVTPAVGVAVAAAGVVTNAVVASQHHKNLNALASHIASIDALITTRSSANAPAALNGTDLNSALDNVLQTARTCLSDKKNAESRSRLFALARMAADGMAVFAAGVALTAAVGALVVCPPLAIAGVAVGLLGLAVSSVVFASSLKNSYSQFKQDAADAALMNQARDFLDVVDRGDVLTEAQIAESKSNRFFALVQLTRQLNSPQGDRLAAHLETAGVSKELIADLKNCPRPVQIDSGPVSDLAKVLYGKPILSRAQREAVRVSEKSAKDNQEGAQQTLERFQARAPQPGMRSDAAPLPAADEKESEPRPQRNAASTVRAEVVLMTRLAQETNPAIQQSLRNQLAANEVLSPLGLQWKRMPGDQECAFHTLRDQLGAGEGFVADEGGNLVVPEATKTNVLRYRIELGAFLGGVIANARLGDGQRLAHGPSSAQALYVAGATNDRMAFLSEPGVAQGIVEPLRDVLSRGYAAGGNGEPGHFLAESLRSARPLVMLDYSNRAEFAGGFGRVMLADPRTLSVTEHAFDGSPNDSRVIADFISSFNRVDPVVAPIFAINNGRNHWDSVEPLPPQSMQVSSDRGPGSSASTPAATTAAAPLTRSVLRGLSEVSRLTDAETFQQAVGHVPVSNPIARMLGASAHYQAVLQGLGDYQARLSRPIADTSDRARDQANEMADALDSLIANADRYIQQHQGDPMREQAIGAMQTLQLQALNEMKLLNDVVALAGKSGGDVLGISWQSAMAGAGYRLLDSVARFNDVTLDPAQGVRAVGAGQMSTVSSASYRAERGPAITLFLKPHVYRESNAQITAEHLRSAGIDPNAPNYSARNVAMSFLNDVLGLDVLVQSTYVLHQDRLHLGMSEAPGETARYLSPPEILDPDQARAVQRIVNALVTEPELLIDTLNLNRFFYAPGEDALKRALQRAGDPTSAERMALLDPGNWVFRRSINHLQSVGDNPIALAGLQRALSDLEWLDALSAQTDRHAGNYKVQFTSDGEVRVTAIDNDLSLGRRHDRCPDGRSCLSGLPQLIDRHLYSRLTAVDFAQEMRPTLITLLSGDEVRATEARFNQLQAHARHLASEDRVIDHDSWQTARVGDQSVSDFLRANRDDRSSYFRRDVA